MKFESFRVRGLKLENRLEQGELMVKVEVLCFDELGIADFMKLVKENKNKIHFTYVRLMGDNHEHGHMSTDHRVKVGQEGFMAMMEAFTVGLFQFTYEFRFYNFAPEMTPLLAFADSLVGNPSLNTIGFACNDLTQDMCAAIMQRLYYNPSLTCLDFNGNNFVSTEFDQ